MNYDARVWVRPRTTTRVELHVIRCYTGEAPMARPVIQWWFRAKQCMWSWCDDPNWKECWCPRFLLSPVTAWHRNMCVVFFRKSWEKSPRSLNMEAPPAQLREESFRGPTSLKTASTTTWHHVLTKAGLQSTTVRSTKSKLTRRFWSRVTVSRPDHSVIMICGEDDEDASDKNTNAIGLEQGQRSRSVPQWAAHYRSSKNE